MFESIQIRKPKLNSFDLSHDKKMSFNMGELVPMMVEEVVPGDKFNVQSEVMLRLAPMVAPVMHRVDVYCHYFFVPNRLIWEDWEEFITGGDDGTAVPVHPYFTMDQLFDAGKLENSTLSDYLGLPYIDTPITLDQNVSVLPFRAYSLLYNEFYRDQNLQDPVTLELTSGASTNLQITDLKFRCWEKDYFTSALPFAQKGDAVNIPGTFAYKDTTTIEPTLGGISAGNVSLHSGGRLESSIPPTVTTTGRFENLEDIGIDINDLRRSNALQKWLELAARGGSRYIEQMLSFFGVQSSDARLQRPEYLGGGKQNVMISEVLQTGETATTPQGNMTGHGISVGATNRFQKGFEEHGYVIGIISVLPKTAYQEGIHRKWTRFDKFDHYFPQFAHLGEQPIANRELYYDGISGVPESTFGYQSRFAEYKHAQSGVHGDFKDNLSYYHMGRIFGDQPLLNGPFVQSDPTHRIFANTTFTDDKLWCQIYHNFKALRPMPYFADPRL